MAENDCRTNLIAAAIPMFAAKGLNGVSVRDIAREAGVNLSMISYYFGGKEGLYAAVLTDQFASLLKIEDIDRMEVNTLQKFEMYVRAIVTRYREYPYLLRFYTSELTNPTPCFETIVKPAIKRVIEILITAFSKGFSHQEFRDNLHPVDSVLSLAGMINFYFLIEPVTEGLIDHSQNRDEELIRHIMDIFTRGVLKS